MRRFSFRSFALLASLCFVLAIAGCRHHGSHAPATDHATSSPLEQALRADVNAGHLAPLHWPDFSDYKPLVQGFYDQRGWDPAWVDDRKPTKQALALAKLFAASGSKGLNPDDYDAPLWQARIAGLGKAGDRDLAAFDLAMTVSAMRYISDLHIGRVNPQHFSFGVNVQAKKYDLAGFLVQQVVAAADMDAALKGVEPDTVEYRDTLDALHHYQELAQQAGDPQPLPAPSGVLSPGSVYPQTGALGARLALLGDLPDDAAGDGGVYTRAVADGVKRFQTRHNLPNDGRLTAQTVAALNVPLETRVHQLQDTLERLRWLPPEYGTAPIAVNIPEFTLRAYDPDHKEAFEMRVVVGRSIEDDHKTPVLVQQMRYLVFRPYWVVTPTIVKQEIVPHVQAAKSYIDEKNFEVVDRSGKPVPKWTPEDLEKNLYMVREKPGPGNSLGLIKFMLPNKLNIYLHSTPATELFNRTRRDFSHGCIRLQEPEKLAAWVLHDQPQWTPDAIENAMENGEDNKVVVLKNSIPVRIFYATARVAEDGTVHFFDDLYGYDKDMEDVLGKGDPFPVRPEPKQETGDTV